MKIMRRSLLVAAIAIATAVTTSVHADTAEFSIEEIIVTAQKRAQSMSDIGVTVSAFGGDEIRELGLTKAQDVAAYTPGLSTSNATSGGTPIFSIRGIGLDDFNSNNTSGVGVYIDEVLAPYPVFLNGQLFDIERVEVLKGPQGTLYGKNTTGGAINYVAIKPTDEFEGYITAGVSRWNTYKLQSAINVPIGDDVKTRLAVSVNDGDGWQEDIDTGRDFGETDNISVRSLTRFDFGGDTSLLLNLHYAKDEGTPVSPQNLTVDRQMGLPSGTIGVASNDAADVRVGGLAVTRDEEGLGISANLTIDFDDVSFTSITALDTYERNVVDNYDGIALNTDDFAFRDEFDVFSQEFRLASDSTDGFSWVAGLSYSFDKIEAETLVDVGALAAAVLGNPSINNSFTRSAYEQVSESYGAFLHTETELSESLKLTLGVRYSMDIREFDGESVDQTGLTALFAGSPVPLPGRVIASLDDRETERDLSGKIGLDYFLNDDWLLYGSVSTSYKSGIFYASPAGDPSALAYIEPEEVMAYELGFKGALFDNTMQINGAYYRYQYNDRQSKVTAISPSVPGLIFATLGNVEESEISGAELEFRWLPYEGWDMRAGVSYIDSEVTKSPGTIRGLTLSSPIEEGIDLAQAPMWSYSTVARYETELTDDYRLAMQLHYSWTGEQSSSLTGTQEIYGELDNLGFRASLEPSDQSWQIVAWASNLENQNSTTYSFTSTEGGQVAYRQQPRSYGVELSYNF